MLNGGEFRRLGQPKWLELLARATNALPPPVSRGAFAAGGFFDATWASSLGRVRSSDLGEWASAAYPPGPYPMIFIGSSSGALVNLCVALRVPWLPQSVLVPVRHLHGRADAPLESCEFGRRVAPPLLEANPDLGLHHMHDPVQDRVMVGWMSYFRVKRLGLGPDYERFLLERLVPGGTIVVCDCRKRWPVRRIAERHVFQLGAVGGADPEDYYSRTDRAASFLREQGSERTAWAEPEPDAEAPEAEWGFEPALGSDIERFAAANGYRVAWLSYEESGALGPLVADLYRWWYARLGWPADSRLVVESFILTAPDLVLRTGSVPFWTVFNTWRDVEGLRHYLDRHAFDEVAVSLFPNGVRALGQASLDDWREQLRRALRRGYFLGVNELRFPFDFAGLASYHRAIRSLPAPHDELPRLDTAELGAFLRDRAGSYGVGARGF